MKGADGLAQSASVACNAIAIFCTWEFYTLHVAIFHAFLYCGGKVCGQWEISPVGIVQGMLVMRQQLNLCDQQNNVLMFGDILLSICVKSKKNKKKATTEVLWDHEYPEIAL